MAEEADSEAALTCAMQVNQKTVILRALSQADFSAVMQEHGQRLATIFDTAPSYEDHDIACLAAEVLANHPAILTSILARGLADAGEPFDVGELGFFARFVAFNHILRLTTEAHGTRLPAMILVALAPWSMMLTAVRH